MADITTVPGLRTLEAHGKEITRIVFFNRTGKLYEQKSGILQHTPKREYCYDQDVRAIDIELKRKRKESWTETSAYTIGTTLYLPAEDWEDEGEYLGLETNTERHFRRSYTFTLCCAIGDRQSTPEPTNQKIRVNTGYTKIEKTEFGKRVADVKAKLEEAGLGAINEYALSQALENFEIVVTEKKRQQ